MQPSSVKYLHNFELCDHRFHNCCYYIDQELVKFTDILSSVVLYIILRVVIAENLAMFDEAVY